MSNLSYFGKIFLELQKHFHSNSTLIGLLYIKLSQILHRVQISMLCPLIWSGLVCIIHKVRWLCPLFNRYIIYQGQTTSYIEWLSQVNAF